MVVVGGVAVAVAVVAAVAVSGGGVAIGARPARRSVE